MNRYIESVIQSVKSKYGYQPEFCQTVEEVLSSLDPVVERHPEYERADEKHVQSQTPAAFSGAG